MDIIFIALFILLIIICLALGVLLYRAKNDIRIYKNSEEKLTNQVEILKHEMEHDPVTGHVNWYGMWKHIGLKTEDRVLPYTFVHFDIKGFKMFNELYDHKVGDFVLCFVSQTIGKQEFVLESARCHNDNFAFFVKPEYDDKIEELLKKFFEDMKFVPGYEERPLYFRCGVVMGNLQGIAKDTVADMAKMAQNKCNKKNCTEIEFYDDKLKEELIKSETLLNDLPEAMMREEILVYLQPKINPNDDTIVGAEALARWNYHGRELWTPYKFIPYLENNNGINLLDEYIVDRVCALFARWKEEGKKLYPISINLSQREIYKETLVEDLVGIVNKYNIERSLIEFELTETAAYEDRDYLLTVMGRLKEAGFSLSMDDFGTGYSSFNLLKDMPLNTLKIDKSFIDSIGDNAGDLKGQRIVEDIVSMVKHLSMICVAEGVEDESQKNILKACGCDCIQGYLYSKPINIEEYEEKYID